MSDTTEDSFVVDELAIAAAARDVAAAEKALSRPLHSVRTFCESSVSI